MKKCPFWVIAFLVVLYFFSFLANANANDAIASGVIKKDERRSIVKSEYGEIWGVKVSDSYHLQFITLEPNALFLPVLLNAHMLFYVHTGSARLSWGDYDQNELQQVKLRQGDVYRLQSGTFFFIQSNLEPERQKLRIHAIFSHSKENPSIGIGAYSSIPDLVLGFDNKLLQAAFNVPGEVIEELKSGSPQPLIVHADADAVPKSKKTLWQVEAKFIKGLLGSRNYGMFDFNNKHRKTKVFNILQARRDVDNCNGWSLTVTKKQLKALRHSDIGVFMVNLTKGAMMGPHWNPMATEIAVVLQGRGMIRVVCSSTLSETECNNTRFRVEEGDVFAVPKFHPMAQLSYNNDTFVFMGFTTASRNNHPQFLAGKRSVLQTLDKLVLAASFKVSNTTIQQLLAPQEESIILECPSCAENEETLMEEEIEKKQEEARTREEEEARKKEEEDEKKRREEEQARKREEEEEEAKRAEEEKQRREEEEEAKRKEEEKRRREEEEEARQKEEEEAKRAEEEKQRREEEEEARHKEEEAKRREEEKQRREEEEARQKEEEEAKRWEKEKQRREKEEEARKREEKEEAQREEKRRQQEAEQEEEEEEARRQEEEREGRQEGEEGEASERRREEEEAAARKEDEERGRRAREEEDEGQEEHEGGGGRILRKMWKF